MERHDESTLRESVIAALGEEAVPRDVLRTRLGAPWDRRGSGRDELDHLLQWDTSLSELGDGFVFVPALLEGTAWTVWIDRDDGAEGFVRMHPALSALSWWLVDDSVELVDGTGRTLGVLETDGWMLDDRDTDVLLGPDGWLDGLIGGWARVEVVDGALRWSAMERAPSPTAAQIAAVRLGFDRAVRHDESHELTGAVPMPAGLRFTSGAGPIHEALLADRAAFRDGPIPPLTDLSRAAGLEQRESLLAAEGFDWEALHDWQVRNRLAVMHSLDPVQADVTAGFLAALAAATASGGASPAALSAEALDDGAVAAAVWDELEKRRVTLEQLDRIAGSASPTDVVSIGQAWLTARVLDRSGDASAAADLLEASVDGRCVHRPALVDLAGLRADRGDAVGALRLLVQAGVDSDRAAPESGSDERDDGELLLDEVHGFATHRPRPAARRNDRCPCGSGRKYKACHLGRETHGLDDRAGWLYLKAQRFARGRQPGAVEELASLVVDEIDQPALFDALIDAPFVGDLVLHEDGLFAEFLAARDHLLPDDEALLGAQWTLIDRSVFEVIDSTATGLELRNVASGDRIRIVNTLPGRQVRPGGLIVGRPLPVGDTYRAFSGFIDVPHRYQDSMLAAIDAGDTEAVAGALSAILAPPQLSNTDGHDLIAHRTTWHVPQPGAVGAALAAAGLRDDGDAHWTLVRDSKNQDNTVIATARLVETTLTVEVNSAERAAELEGLVAGALPDAQIVDVDASPFELPDSPVRTPDMRPLDVDDPAIRAALAEHMADYERRWLDESIPALGGRTPREAAGDPIGREELTRLLASIPVPPDDDAVAMSPDRLRAALGL